MATSRGDNLVLERPVRHSRSDCSRKLVPTRAALAGHPAELPRPRADTDDISGKGRMGIPSSLLYGILGAAMFN